jgi:hypothetical protein
MAPGTRECRSIDEPHIHPRVTLYRTTYDDITRRYDTVPDTRECHSIGEPHMHPKVPFYRSTYGDTVSGGLRTPHVHPRTSLNRSTHSGVMESHLRMCKLRVCVCVQPNIFLCIRHIRSQLHEKYSLIYVNIYIVYYTQCIIYYTHVL